MHLIVSGETLEHRGATITYKSLLGGELISTASDGYLALPPCDWLEKDWKLVKLDQGRFYAEVDPTGNHADTFDATKLAKHELMRGGGPAKATAVATGSLAKGGSVRAGIRNPYARQPIKTTALHV